MGQRLGVDTVAKAAGTPVAILASSTWVRGGIIPDNVTKIEEAWNGNWSCSSYLTHF